MFFLSYEECNLAGKWTAEIRFLVRLWFNWSLLSLLNRTKSQLQVSACGEPGACARKSGRRCYACKAANKNRNANCQCRWHSCSEVTKLKIIKRPAVRYFSIFLFEIQKIFIRKCSTFIFNPQALPGSLKFRTWCFSLTLFTEYEAIQTLDT